MNEENLILSTLQQVADTIANTFTYSIEVVVHDLSDPQSSIKYISGNVTNRRVGGPSTDLLIKKLHKEGEDVKDQYNYKTISKDGRELKSSTSFFRNSKGEVVAALCVNFDMTQYLNAKHALEMLTDINESNASGNLNYTESFASTIDETIDTLFNQAVSKIGKQPSSMSMQERVNFVQELETLGVFQIKGSIHQIGMRMGVSKYTIYNYLKTNKNKQYLKQI